MAVHSSLGEQSCHYCFTLRCVSFGFAFACCIKAQQEHSLREAFLNNSFFPTSERGVSGTVQAMRYFQHRVRICGFVLHMYADYRAAMTHDTPLRGLWLSATIRLPSAVKPKQRDSNAAFL